MTLMLSQLVDLPSKVVPYMLSLHCFLCTTCASPAALPQELPGYHKVARAAAHLAPPHLVPLRDQGQVAICCVPSI